MFSFALIYRRLPLDVMVVCCPSSILGAGTRLFLYNSRSVPVIIPPDTRITRYEGTRKLLAHNQIVESDRCLDLGSKCKCSPQRQHVLIGASTTESMKKPHVGLGQIANSTVGTDKTANCKYICSTDEEVWLCSHEAIPIPASSFSSELLCSYSPTCRRWKYVWDSAKQKGSIISDDATEWGDS